MQKIEGFCSTKKISLILVSNSSSFFLKLAKKQRIKKISRF